MVGDVPVLQYGKGVHPAVAALDAPDLNQTDSGILAGGAVSHKRRPVSGRSRVRSAGTVQLFGESEQRYPEDRLGHGATGECIGM